MAPKNQDLILNNQEAGGIEGELGELPLLTTKFYRPPVTPDLEQRTRLIDFLAQQIQRPLTLISAPAGYGKTILASMWLESCGCSYGWVSLDEYDNDLHAFVRYLLVALRGAIPTLQLKTTSLLGASNTPSQLVLTRYLLNDLNQIQEPFVLVLDDFQCIKEPAIYELLDELLRHPSQSMKLVLIGRHDPRLNIASLRAHGQVTEIRAQDLRFTAQETRGLLSSMLDRQVDEAVAVDWTRMTEGWVTALRLAALSLRYRGREDDLRVSIQGNSRYLSDYLLGEVLAHLPAGNQAWLLKSALLDRFCASLIEALCQNHEDPEQLTGKDFIGWLELENLFLVPLDDRGEWFRFHHLFQQLLLEMLQRQVNPSEISELRMRVSQWFAENDLLDEALRYALAAGDMGYASSLVAQHRHQIMNLENWSILEKWLKMFPHDVIENDPILSITKAYLPSSFGPDRYFYISQARRLLATLPADSPMSKEIRGEIATSDALECVITGQAAEAIAVSVEALALLPSHAQYYRSIAFGTLAMGHQMSGDFDRGISIIEGALSDPGLPINSRARFLINRAWPSFMESDLTAALRFSGECLRQVLKYHLWDTISEARYISGIAYYLRNELDLAELELRALVDEPELYNPVFLAMAACALARMVQAQGHPEIANELFQRVVAYLEEVGNTYSLEILHAFQVELVLDRGEPDLARRLSRTINLNEYHSPWYHYMPQLTPIKLMLAEGNNAGLMRELTSLARLGEELHRMNRQILHIDVLALQALVYVALGDISAGLDSLTEALQLAYPGGFIRNFVDLGEPMADLLIRLKARGSGGQYKNYIDRILAAFKEEVNATQAFGSAVNPSKSQPPNKPLTNLLTMREQQVLRLLATDLSPQEIADRLVISLDTLRVHRKNIYRKLDVHKRVEAIQLADKLDIL